MNALLEIGTEHLPARFLSPALTQLKTLAENILTEKRLSFERIETFGTYRRLVLVITGISDQSADMKQEIKGPPAKLLKDAAGNFTPQSTGFAQKNGLKPQALIIKDTDKGPFVFACVTHKGEKTAKLLPEIFTRLVTGLEFAKNMVWEASGLRYGRPIRSLIGLYGNKVIKFTVAGVTSNRYTYSLLSFGNKPLKVLSADKEAYIKLLKDQNPPILVVPQDRRDALVKSVCAEAAARGCEADLDETLIHETVCFTEHPVAVCGDMELKALTLPRLLITTVLKQQLKMFPVINKKGALQPYFIAVRDGSSANQNEVRDGFKKVMSARLSDAVFFFENDKKEGLPSFHQKLNHIQFLEGVGTLADKAQRVQQIASKLCEQIGCQTLKDTVSYAALHCYDDLASHVVYEFPELQGYMGGQYAALESDLPGALPWQKEAAKAMEQCYWPLTSSSELPQTEAGNIVSLAGKLDTLAGNFLIGQIPSGSEDPFALRRQGFAIIRILLENNWNLTVNQALQIVQQAYATVYAGKWTDTLTRQLNDFLGQRLGGVLELKGHSASTLKAITQWDKLPLKQIEHLTTALEQIQTSATFPALREVAKRVENILKKSETNVGKPQEKFFESSAEKTLFEVARAVPSTTATTVQAYLSALQALQVFQKPLEQFFKEVMVQVPDQTLRNNRLALLALVREKLTQMGADISSL